MAKEKWVFYFPSIQRAEYWRERTIEKFSEDVVRTDRFKMFVEFPEAFYYFVRKDNKLRSYLLRPDFECTEEDLYCILDDQEFQKLQGDKDGR